MFVKETSIPKFHSSSSWRSIKALALLSVTTVRRSTVDQEDMKSYWKIRFLEVINKRIIYRFFEDFISTERRLTRHQFLVIDLLQTFLNIEKK